MRFLIILMLLIPSFLHAEDTKLEVAIKEHYSYSKQYGRKLRKIKNNKDKAAEIDALLAQHYKHSKEFGDKLREAKDELSK